MDGKLKHSHAVVTNILLGALLVNAVWWTAARIFQTPALVDPLTVYAHLGDAWQQSMSTHLAASLWRVTVSVVLAGMIGLAVALWMVRARYAGKLLNAFVYFSYPVPKLALLPIVMLLAGLGDLTKIIMIVLIIVFQIIVNLRDSLLQIPAESYVMLTSLGANRRQLFRHVTLPAVLPGLLSALRVAIGTAISVLFVTETYGTDRGMGYYIVDAWMRINYVDMYAGIVVLSMAGFFLFLLIDLLEKALCRWREA
ncbi:MAG: ABC transporter permease [Prevotellaceae bacterium]|jgi:NitT/TauT family transport system permease protein|nr:ABC transporter permease [Prevotellaceae bacterium]